MKCNLIIQDDWILDWDIKYKRPLELSQSKKCTDCIELVICKYYNKLLNIINHEYDWIIDNKVIY